jgi:hypothetical protein
MCNRTFLNNQQQTTHNRNLFQSYLFIDINFEDIE